MRIGQPKAKLTTPATTSATFKADGGPAIAVNPETVDFNPPIQRAKCNPETGEPDVYRHALLIRVPSRTGKDAQGKPWATLAHEAVALFASESHVRIACTLRADGKVEVRDGSVRTVDVADFEAVKKSGLVK